MTPERTFSYFSQGLRLQVLEWGEADAPVLVLLHGVRDHARSWDLLAGALSARHRVLAPDLRGHGDSEHARGSSYPTEAYLVDLAGLVSSQKLGPFTIVGHSLGGNIGLRYAAIYPENVHRIVAIEGLSHSPKLVAEQKAMPVEQRLRDWIDGQRQISAKPARRYASLEEAAARYLARHPTWKSDFVAHLTRHAIRTNTDGTVSFKFDPALRAFPPVELAAEDAMRLWSLVTCPAFLVYGAQSWASNPALDGRAAHFPQAEVLTLEGVGHWAHHDQPEAFLSAVEAFLTLGA